MVFSSLLFLLLFLPLTIGVYYLTPSTWRNTVLLLASLLFYTWGEGVFVLLMLFSIALNYTFARLIDATIIRHSRKIFLLCAISCNLALLIFYKYANFILDNVNILFASVHLPTLHLEPIHLPIGISFFTFQALSYVIDVYRKDAPVQKNLAHVALYISLFPQLIAGPIIRYHDVAKQIVRRTSSIALFSQGAQRFILGLAKKVLIANTLGKTADTIFALESAHLSPELAWLGIVCYTLQLYFDFSAYSDMAIGLGMMFGFRFLENFNYPYIAQSIREFWQRWHMSLSRWFRDYLYIPLGGNRCGHARVTFNLLLVFLLCGLWHGASWNFILWGLIHGSLLMFERIGGGRLLEQLWRPLRHAYVLLVVMFAWVFFRAEDVTHALAYCQTLLGMSAAGVKYPLVNYIHNELIVVLLIACAGSLPLLKAVTLRPLNSGKIAFHLIALWLCCAYLAAQTHNPFIYFRF